MLIVNCVCGFCIKDEMSDLRKRIKNSESDNSSQYFENISKNADQIYLNEFKNSINDLEPKKNSYHLTRIVLVRYLAFIYCK